MGCTARPMRTTPAASVLLTMSPPKRRNGTAVRYSGMPNWYLLVMTQACASSVRRPRGMMRAGVGATFKLRSQQRHAYLMRWCCSTRTSGMTCICSLTSAPISTNAWPSCAQMRSDSGNSWRTMSRGSAGSSGLRPRFLRWWPATAVDSSSSISTGSVCAVGASASASLRNRSFWSVPRA